MLKYAEAKIISIKSKGKSVPVVELTCDVSGERIKYNITEGTYRKIGCPLLGEFIDPDSLVIVASEDERRRALASALSVLSYGDHSEQALLIKLKHRGYSKDVSIDTVRECVSLGYIDEQRQLKRMILKFANEELLGSYKILAKLMRKYYPRRAICQAISELSESGELDFKESRKKLIEKTLGDSATDEEIYKLLSRYGYIRC